MIDIDREASRFPATLFRRLRQASTDLDVMLTSRSFERWLDIMSNGAEINDATKNDMRSFQNELRERQRGFTIRGGCPDTAGAIARGTGGTPLEDDQTAWR